MIQKENWFFRLLKDFTTLVFGKEKKNDPN